MFQSKKDVTNQRNVSYSRQNLKQKPWGNTAYWLILCVVFNWLSLKSRNHLSRCYSLWAQPFRISCQLFSHFLVQNMGTCPCGLMQFCPIYLNLLVLYLGKLHMYVILKWMTAIIFHLFLKIFLSFWTSLWKTWENMICIGKKKWLFFYTKLTSDKWTIGPGSVWTV